MVKILNDFKMTDSYKLSIDTNQAGKKILVEQDQHGLKFFLLEHDGEKKIDKQYICGLPKAPSLPPEFFLSSRVKIQNDGKRIEFLGRLLGGMDRNKSENLKSSIACNTKTTVSASGGISRFNGLQGSINIERSFKDCGQTTCKKSGSYQAQPTKKN